MNKFRVYVVEDELLIARALEIAIEESGYEYVGGTDNAGEAIKDIIEIQPDIVLLDITIAGEKDGIALAHEINKISQTPFLFVTSHTTDQFLMRVNETHPAGFISKPFNESDIKANIMIAMNNHEDRLAKQAPPVLSYDEKILGLLRENIVQHLEKEDISVESLAETVSMSESTLRRFLKKMIDQSPGNFIREVRLEVAYELLKNKQEKSISQVANQVGFQNVNHFSQLFEKKYGLRASSML
ncbi:response regulator [Reichenbachiella carrageenanivorans]|uniref:Response regulator n=1 Tax=Reichenbachiella carrageenanivorans TaxID=2979869 RepID=A0ABY6D057_9BACT|nr:response regulator [Reichenbachiella carrageenanivorans]UXX78448.1 response regulator [Reichenbachiella carrageenanivorans]